MIELYIWGTPNGRKASIMLEEVVLPYEVHPVNIGKNEQHDPPFLKISPNNKIPAIVDRDAPGGPLSVTCNLRHDMISPPSTLIVWPVM